MTIAGHDFRETHIGRACISCLRRWTSIRNTTIADLDQPNIAHVGNVTRTEIEEIVAECAAEDGRIHAATRTAAGFGIGGMAAGAGVHTDIETFLLTDAEQT